MDIAHGLKKSGTPERTKGKVHTYSSGVKSGLIICEHGKTYLFSWHEWATKAVPPAEGVKVVFTPDNGWAKSITTAIQEP